MRVTALVLAISVVALAKPQFRLTAKEYEALQVALDGRIPVAISSGRQLYNDVDENPNNFVVVDFGGSSPVISGGPPVITDDLLREAPNPLAGIGDFGQGVLRFGQGVLDALGETAAELGRAAEDTLQGIASLAGIARSGVASRTLPVAAEEAPADVAAAEGGAVEGGAVGDAAVVSARTGELDTTDGDTSVVSSITNELDTTAGDTSVLSSRTGELDTTVDDTAVVLIITDELDTTAGDMAVASARTGELDITAGDSAVVSARTGELDTTVESVAIVAESVAVVTVAPSFSEPNLTESETTDSVTETTSVTTSSSTTSLVTEAVSTSSSSATEVASTASSTLTEAVAASSTTVTEPIDETLNEIVPPAPQEEENASAVVAEARTGPVAAEDTAIAPAAPEEAVVAPPLAEIVVTVSAGGIRKKRQLLEDEEPISNARQLGTGLATLTGLFGSTVGRFLDSFAVAAVEMIDGLESLGTIAVDQVENSFDDDPNNDFIRR